MRALLFWSVFMPNTLYQTVGEVKFALFCGCGSPAIDVEREVPYCRKCLLEKWHKGELERDVLTLEVELKNEE
jgi:hypothetical protein